MTLKHLRLLLLAIVACTAVVAQGEDELHIPVENDNQFPPDIRAGVDDTHIEGSGVAALEEPVETTLSIEPTTLAPVIEEVQPTVLIESETTTLSENEQSCPKPCVCHTDGDTGNFVVDCSGYGLTEFPTPLDSKTTVLNLENNKLTEIPKEVAALKNLKVLNANDNSIMALASGSISELPELTVLKLANNRLIEYPNDLKNSFSLTKLEELDLGGNDMRTELKPESFSNFISLRTLTIPTSTDELIQDLCESLKDSLDKVCTGSCNSQFFECPDAPDAIDDDLLDATLPGMISISDDDMDPELPAPKDDAAIGTHSLLQPQETPVSTKDETSGSSSTDASLAAIENATPTSEFSLRTAVNKEPQVVATFNNIIEPPKETAGVDPVPEVKVGATTTDSKAGGVDKSVIGLVVAGMIVVVAGVTIKKNWSSIKKRFGSAPRAPERGTANGSTPEEVPLQDKSPV